MPCQRYAARVPGRGSQRRRIVIGLPNFVIAAPPVAMLWLVCMISRTMPVRVGRTFFFEPSATAREPRPIGPRRQTTAHARRPIGRHQPANAPRRFGERTESAHQLKLATTDALTGARTRTIGLEEVARELERAHRTGAGLVLAFVDVDGLKELNDSQGHLAGDARLRLLGETLRANVRTYDVVVRYGGDELLCALQGASPDEGRARLENVAAVLAVADASYSVTFGLAQAVPADGLQELIARANADFLEARQSRTTRD
jgi:diguanylate cyclase (GGDEF)-like protein